jgi:L-alanine-DL-glutamate epimerase-like enolase superfamily enzyme
MKLISVEAQILDIPFCDGGAGEGLTPTPWRSLEVVLIRVETDTGLVGWGEAFGYFCSRAVKSVIDRMIVPAMTGQKFTDPRTMITALQRKLVLFGRYGITMFAISGLDIALWDIATKAEEKTLADYIGGIGRNRIPTYASLVRYGDAGAVRSFTERALEDGYSTLKLHEITMPEIEVSREVAHEVGFIVDVNCNWSVEDTRTFLPPLRNLGAMWLEEPIFPPEDFAGLASLAGTVPLAAGENLCTAYQFSAMQAAGAVTFPQPSITKVGGVTEFLKIADAADQAGQQLMPHSPYFGPGYFATLQIAAARECIGLFEYLYVWPDAFPGLNQPLPRQGYIALPDGPGIGFSPDPEILTRYRVA